MRPNVRAAFSAAIRPLGLAQKQLNILASQLHAIFGRYSFAKSSKELAIAPQVAPDGLKTVPGSCSIGSTESDPNLSAKPAKLFLRELSIEFSIDVLQMCLDGLCSDIESCGDFLVAQPVRQQSKDFLFALGEKWNQRPPSCPL